MKKTDLSAVMGGIALLVSLWWLISNKKGFWWYILALFVVIPTISGIGYALGSDSEATKQARLDCEEKGGAFSRGVCYNV